MVSMHVGDGSKQALVQVVPCHRDTNLRTLCTNYAAGQWKEQGTDGAGVALGDRMVSVAVGVFKPGTADHRGTRACMLCMF